MTTTKRTPRARRDPLERELEAAFEPGSFIYARECYSLVSDLEKVAGTIDRLEPIRAIGLWEKFVAACRLKAGEIDDSSGSFSTFALGVICRWVKARCQAGASPEETVVTLLEWRADDPYAFFYDGGRQLVAAFDKAGLSAFEREVRGRWEDSREATDMDTAYEHRCLGDLLRHTYLHQKNAKAYQAFAEEAGFEPRDCLAMARILAPRRPEQALAWADRGIQMEKATPHTTAAELHLKQLRTDLLLKLGRKDDAIDDAWEEFRQFPSKYCLDDLLKIAPAASRAAWREKALDFAAANVSDLHSTLQLFSEANAPERLAAVVRRASDEQLIGTSHYGTEPAAEKLEKSHPDLAARLWLAQALRVIEPGKSRYYDAAESSLARARTCFLKANQEAQWDAAVKKLRAEHPRKARIMAALESINAGVDKKKKAPPSSFIDRAMDEWKKSRRH